MSPSIDQQKEKFQEALQRKYTACIFDIDGTLTVRGDEFMPASILSKLADLSMKVPMAVCTGRRLQHAHEKLAPLFYHAVDPIRCQANWMLVCENGAIAYLFDPQKKEYVECYREPYPYPEDLRVTLFNHLNKVLENKLGISFMNVVSMVFSPPWDGIPPDELDQRSREIAMIIQREILPFDPKGLLAVGNSGIGVIISPFKSNKERGIIEFARSVASRHGYRISKEAREIVAIGDQPEPMGNDELFLDGAFGTPFTVGNTHPENLLPLPVFDSNGNILKGPEATLYLVGQLQFRDDHPLNT